MAWRSAAVLVGALALVGCAADTAGRPPAEDPPSDAVQSEEAANGPSLVEPPPEPGPSEPPSETDTSDGSSDEPHPDPDAETLVDATVLFTAEYTGIDSHLELVIRDPAEWRDLWARIVAGQDPAPEVPAVDFESDMVLVVGTGERPSGGYTVEIVDVRRHDRALRVVVLERIPGRECAVTRAITSPVVAVTAPRSDEPVEFEHRTETYACPDADGS
jgi:hypothetical protein